MKYMKHLKKYNEGIMDNPFESGLSQDEIWKLFDIDVSDIDDCIIPLKDFGTCNTDKGFIQINKEDGEVKYCSGTSTMNYIGDSSPNYLQNYDYYYAYQIDIYIKSDSSIYELVNSGIYLNDLDNLKLIRDMVDEVYSSINKIKNHYNYNNVYYDIDTLGAHIIISSNNKFKYYRNFTTKKYHLIEDEAPN